MLQTVSADWIQARVLVYKYLIPCFVMMDSQLVEFLCCCHVVSLDSVPLRGRAVLRAEQTHLGV